MLTVGDPAPDFTFPTDDGSLTLSALRGHPVVLYFYPKDATPGCTTEAQGFRDLHARFAAAGVRILGVSRDSVRSHQNFKAKQCLPFTLVSDTGGLCESYGVIRQKKLYGREYEGIARVTFLIGADGTITRIWDPVKAAGHAEEVLAAVGG